MSNAFRPSPLLPSLALALLGFHAPTFGAEMQLEAEVWQDGAPAEADYEVRLLIDRGQPWLKQTQSLGVLRAERGRLNAPVQLDERLLAEAQTFELELRPAGSDQAYTPVAKVAAKGICTLSPWTLTGNSDATGNSFIGTTNAQPLRFRSQNQAVGSIDAHVQQVGVAVDENVNLQLGWPGNSIGNNAWGNVVLGGALRLSHAQPNQVQDNSSFSTISGGYGNTATGSAASIGGGTRNRAAANGTVAGGAQNQANGISAVIAGGSENLAGGSYTSIGGGQDNETAAFWSAVPGGIGNLASGDSSLAAGAYASAAHEGSFVWSQSSNNPMESSAIGQVVFGARGGFGINGSAGPIAGTPLNAELTVRTSGTPDNNVDIALLNSASSNSTLRGFSIASVPNGQFYITSLFNNGGSLRYDPMLGITATSLGIGAFAFNRGAAAPQLGAILQVGDGGNDGNGAHLSSGGSWTNASSREFKTAFSLIDPEQILDRLLSLPLSTWTYRDSAEGRHLGPVAEEFQAAFELGNDAQRISTVDADGVSMAAIQGLNIRLERENAALRKRLERLEQRLGRIESGLR